MAAEKNNKYAEKWTIKETLSFLNKVRDEAIAYNHYHLQRLIIDCGGYATLWAYLTEKWSDNQEVFDTVKEIEQILESNIIIDSLKGTIKGQAMAIFYLKNKHGYVDKSEVDNNVKLGAEAQGITIGYVDKDGNVNRTR